MLSHEERIAEVKRRIAEKEHQKRLRQARIAAVSGVAACLAVIVGVSLFMPGIVEQIELGISSGNDVRRQRHAGIYRHRTACLCSRRMRDDFVFPNPSAEQRGTDGGAKGGQCGWNLSVTFCNSSLPCWALA